MAPCHLGTREQGIIFHTVIDARGRNNGGTLPNGPVDDRVKFFEHEVFASLKVSVRLVLILLEGP